MSRIRIVFAVAVLLSLACLPLRAAEQATVRVDASHVLRTMDHHMLLGTNVALWTGADTFSSPQITGWMRALDPHLIRMPGGSWSDITFWNGNGVRRPDGSVDTSRMKDGYPEIDYSAYAPTVTINNKLKLNTWCGWVDVKTLHEYIQGLGAHELVTVNGGTGRALDAAEWVRWADKMGYKVDYWEVGNELGGSWEEGHVMRNGKTLTGPVFADRFEKFATAMKKVDPKIKVGCMDWVGDVMGHCGGLVDFLTWHTYPLHESQTRPQMLAAAFSVPAGIARQFHEALAKGPAGSGKRIQVGVSEWNLGLTAGLNEDMFGALWSSIFIGEMYRDGIDFATLWEAFPDLIRGRRPARMAQYWTLYLWDHYMGDSLVQAGVEGKAPLYAYATTEDGALDIMLINTDQDEPVETTVDLSGFEPAAQGERALLSHRGYFWNAIEHRADWSYGPTVLPLKVGKSFQVEAPPMSIECIRVPAASKPGISEQARKDAEAARKPAGTPELRILMPKTQFSDTPIEGWVRAYKAGTDEPYPAPLPAAKIAVSGPATAEPAQARLAEAAGRFMLKASAPGEVTVKASADGAEATATVQFKASNPKPRVLWDFEQPTLGRGYSSSWKLSTDDSVRPNQRVARIELDGAVNNRKQGMSLLVISDFPPRNQLNRANIRGVFFDMMVSPDLKCADPNAHVDVVMQSTGDYWMVLGSAPLSAARGKWVTVSFPVTKPGHIRAMPYAFNVFLALRTSKPITGTVYIDKAGLMVR